MESRRLRKDLLGLLRKRCDWLAKGQELLFGLAHDFYEDLALPTALAPKTPHDLLQVLMQAVRLSLEVKGSAAALLSDVVNKR